MVVVPKHVVEPLHPASARIVIGRISVVVAHAAPTPSAPTRQPITHPRPATGHPNRGRAHGGASGSASRFTHRFGIGQL